ncbi:MAG: hypothetical protein Q7T17_06745 [Microbacterium sp.]|uniref:hypothetical protein n=1 Tax=Microbacterium sp. TaxID=51671 RepID=UPI00271F4FD1|nr:hypothetical protein [Microbacterium sp.]MDO8382660.1 hypothetical protein [Microbacterium sp.]
MTVTLKLDTEDVASAARSMGTIVTNLERADADASALAGMIPVPELARAAEDFAGKWDDRRRTLIEEINALKEQASAVAEAFDAADSSLVDVLTRPPEQAPPAHPNNIPV